MNLNFMVTIEMIFGVTIVCRDWSSELPPWGIKKALAPYTQGTRTESIFCGTTLFAAEATTSCRCQHTRCPVTLAKRQKILRTSLFPLPSTAHLPTRFSPRSQLCGTLCGCAADVTSVSTVSHLSYAYYTHSVSVCQALFFTVCGQILPMAVG